MSALTGKKILVTGATGRVGFPIARSLARENEVWALARFKDSAARTRCEELKIRCIPKDLGIDPLDDLPTDFTHVFHAAAAIATTDWDEAFRVNVSGTERLAAHCRATEGFVYVSTGSVYERQGHRPLSETDVLVRENGAISVYASTKLAGEEVVRRMSEREGLPIVIARLFNPYGPVTGAPAARLRLIASGREVPLSVERPNFVSPVFEDDLILLSEVALTRGGSPPLVVNLAGSEVVSAEEYCGYMGKLIGVEPRFTYTDTQLPQLIADVTLMHERLGRCEIGWQEGMRRVVAAMPTSA